MKPLIEICLDRIDSVEICRDAGIERIELCSALSEGGLTPSVGFIKAARRIFPGKMMMMIRPRAGDFLYSAAEMKIMMDDIQVARDHGADGVVFGCLQACGKIDERSIARLQECAAELDVTFHRAFDVTPDLSESLATLIKLGIPRVLSSGGESDVWKGASRLQSLVKQAEGKIVIMPGGGVVANRIGELLHQTGTNEIHLSSRRSIKSAMIYHRDDIAMGATQITPDDIHRITDAEQLRMMLSSKV